VVAQVTSRLAAQSRIPEAAEKNIVQQFDASEYLHQISIHLNTQMVTLTAATARFDCSTL
jgi:hypothetical protein